MDELVSQVEAAWDVVDAGLREATRRDQAAHAGSVASALIRLRKTLESQAEALSDESLARCDASAHSAIEELAHGDLISALDPWRTDRDEPYAIAALLVVLGPTWLGHAQSDPTLLAALHPSCDASFALKLWRREQCLRALDAAWRDVRNPGQREIDSYQADGAGDISALYTADWRDLDVTVARRFASGLVFFSPRAFHNFVPMWLRAMLLDPVGADVAVESTLRAFSGPDEGRLRERLALFSPSQTRATLAVLELVFGRPLPWFSGAGQLAHARKRLAPIAAHG